MKSSSDNPQFDNFIREALKTSGTNSPMVDWSEVEVLLKHEQKSIPIKIDRKTVLIAGAVLGIFIAGFGIFKFVQYGSSLPEETNAPADSVKNILTAIDTQATKTADTSTAMIKQTIDTSETEIDSMALASQEKKADSIIADFKEKEKQTLSEKTNVGKTTAQTEPKKIEKKNSKISSLAPTISDAAPVFENILPPDTAGKNKSETKIIIPASSTDSLKNSPAKKNKKTKKLKSSSDSSKVKSEITPAKPDSLK